MQPTAIGEEARPLETHAGMLWPVDDCSSLPGTGDFWIMTLGAVMDGGVGYWHQVDKTRLILRVAIPQSGRQTMHYQDEPLVS